MGLYTSTSAIMLASVTLASLNLGGNLYPPQGQFIDNSEYDYIIVGGGTAGCVLARRLVEDGVYKVLVIEAGDDPPPNALLPGLFVTLPKTRVDYDFLATRSYYAAGSEDNRTTLTAGKMLGGSASMNHLVHTRGCSEDFDTWANISGSSVWKYKNFLEYFIRSENVTDSEILQAYSDYHGTEGPTGLTRQTSDDATPILKAFEQDKHPSVLDINADIYIGYTQPQYIISNHGKKRQRQTPALTYLSEVKDNSNLRVLKNTTVTKIVIDSENVASGVLAENSGNQYTFRAKKEVILCAGVFNTPKLLMLSGIGPKELLKKFDIELKADLPVGNNVIEQVAISLVFKTNDYLLPIPNTKAVPDPTKVPFPIIVGNVALDKNQKCPDYQAYVLLLTHDSPYLNLVCKNTFFYRSDICNRFQSQVIRSDSIYVLLANLIPKSRGTVRLRSKDPYDKPVITTGFYTDENNEDLNNMVKFIKDFIKVNTTPEFREMGAKLVGLDLPECSDREPLSDRFWECYAKNLAISLYHYTSSCPMGTVVDGELQVQGIEQLRIVDGSVMPVNPKGGPFAAVVAIAELAADLIKGEISNN